MSEADLATTIVKIFHEAGWSLATWTTIVTGGLWLGRRLVLCSQNVWGMIQPKLEQFFSKHMELIDELKISNQQHMDRLNALHVKIEEIHRATVKP